VFTGTLPNTDPCEHRTEHDMRTPQDQLVHLATQQEAIRRSQALVEELCRERSPITVLEAGCGSITRFDVGPDATVVGVDVSPKQLTRNERLDERIVGDIQDVDLGTRTFDIIVCWEVLEHVSHPHRALDNLIGRLSRGGLLILAVPNVRSFKGLVTKLTPYRAHVIAYRVLFGERDAGHNDAGPFPTFLRWAISPGSLLRYAHTRRLSVTYFGVYESPMQQTVRDRYRLLGWAWTALERAATAVSRSRFRPGATEVLLVLRREL